MQVLENEGREALASKLAAMGLRCSPSLARLCRSRPDRRPHCSRPGRIQFPVWGGSAVADHELYRLGPWVAFAFYRPHVPSVGPPLINALDLWTGDPSEYRPQHLCRPPIRNDGRGLDGAVLPERHRGCRLVSWNSLFPVWLPIRQVFTCGVAILPMALALTLIRFPLNWVGLLTAIALGTAVYIVSAIALDVGEVRSIGLSALRRRLRAKGQL